MTIVGVQYLPRLAFYHSSTSILFNLNLSFLPVPKPTQKQLLQLLYHTVADRWKPIGIYLDIPGPQLKVIDKQHRGDPQECLMAMLTDCWLPRLSPPPTWQEIAEAVEFVGYPNVAQKLRDKFCECHTYSSIGFISFLIDANYLTSLIVFHRPTVYSSIHSHLKLQLRAMTDQQPHLAV